MKKNIAYLTILAFILTSCEKILIGPEPENTAKSNFDMLWKSFDENYALFKLNKSIGILYT